MKVNQLLQINEEAKENIDSNESLFPLIKRDCGPFLALNTDLPLYRGMNLNSGDRSGKKEHRTDRFSRDSAPEFNLLFNAMVQLGAGIPNVRASSIFCAANSEQLSVYGHPCYIFPIGDFQVLWSEEISDSTTHAADIREKVLEELASILEIPKLRGVASVAIRNMFDFMIDVPGMNIDFFLKPPKDQMHKFLAAANFDGLMAKHLKSVDGKTLHAALLKALKNTYKHFYISGGDSSLKKALTKKVDEIMITKSGGYYYIATGMPGRVNADYEHILDQIKAA